MKNKDKTAKNKSGWMILNSRNQIQISKLIGKITLIIERNKYMGKQKLRISKKTLDEVYDLLEKKTQRIKQK